jgi:hypothetical protein
MMAWMMGCFSWQRTPARRWPRREYSTGIGEVGRLAEAPTWAHTGADEVCFTF